MLKNFHMLKDIDRFNNLNKNELLLILKTEASDICIIDIMQASIFLSEDAKYVQGSYRKEYLKSYTEAFITRLKVMKDDKEEYKSHVDCEKLTKNEVFRAPKTLFLRAPRGS